jgi:hypothetical protein
VKESFVGFAHAGVVITSQFVSGYVQLCWDGELLNWDFLVLVSQDMKEGCFGECWCQWWAAMMMSASLASTPAASMQFFWYFLLRKMYPLLSQ